MGRVTYYQSAEYVRMAKLKMDYSLLIGTETNIIPQWNQCHQLTAGVDASCL